jgi:hypothetical protein
LRACFHSRFWHRHRLTKTLRPHAVPVWFGWDGESLWISSFRSTRKIKNLRLNPYCSIAIDIAQSGWDFQAMILRPCAAGDGTPRLRPQKDHLIYTRYLGPEGVLAPDPQSWISDPENLLIKLNPDWTYTTYSARKLP